jgi:hypothetical protein
MELLFPALWAQGLAGTIAAQLVIYDVSLVKSAFAQISLSTIYYVAWFAVLEGRSGAVPVANQTAPPPSPVCTEARDIVDHLSSSRFMKGEQDVAGFLDIRALWKDPRRGSDLRQPSAFLAGKYSTTQVLEGLDGLMKNLRVPEFVQLLALLPLT